MIVSDYSKPSPNAFISPGAPAFNPQSGMAAFGPKKTGPIGNVIANAKGEGGNTAANGYSEVGM